MSKGPLSPLRDEDVPGPGRDYTGYGRNVPVVRWPDGARLALSVVINYEEGSEYSMPAGDGMNEGGMGELAWTMESGVRDLAIESVYEYGSRAGIWRLQRLVDGLRIPVTMYACAVALERNPEVAAWIAESGHEACGHGWRWEQVWRLSREDEKSRITAAVDTIEALVGTRPLGWASRYNPSVHTRELLHEVGGFVYDSDAYNDDLPYYTSVKGQRWLVVPYSLTYNDARFVIPVGHSGPESFLEQARRALDYLCEEGESHPRMMTIGLHARHVGQAGRASALRDFLQFAQDKGVVWFARRIDIANWWNEHSATFAGGAA